MPSGCTGMSFSMPAMSLCCHMAAWACLSSSGVSSVGVPVCTPAVFRHYLMMAWHTCSHTCLGPAPTHDVTGSSVLPSAKFLCYQVVVQVCLLARQPCLSDSTCWLAQPTSFLICRPPMPSSVGTGVPVHLLAVSQHCNLATGAWLLSHLPIPPLHSDGVGTPFMVWPSTIMRGTGMILCMPTLSQYHHGAVKACSFAHMLCPSDAI